MEECICMKNDCKTTCVLEVVLSILLGIIFGILFAIGVIPIVVNFIRIALVMSVLSMAILGGTLFASNLLKRCNVFEKCLCRINKCLLVSVFGTFLTATAAAIIGVTVISTLSIIVVALTMFFFIWMILSDISLFNCLIKGTCKD